jgi:hypothetical protein
MMKYVAGVLTVIAIGVMLVAYGLLAPRLTASTNGAAFGVQAVAPDGTLINPYAASYGAGYANPYAASYQPSPWYGSTTPVAMPVSDVRPARTVTTVADAPRVVSRRTVVSRAPRRDWKKTALVIGGSSAAGAGIGAIFGGKKGALIGAALGGGASTIYETTKGGR